MCDEADFAEEEAYIVKAGISRRHFSQMAGAAGVLTLMPAAAYAGPKLTEREVIIKTPDGMADCFFVYPAKGKYSAVLIWPDIFGLRPAFKDMARRLAGAGHAVLVVNPFYRAVKAPVLPIDADQRAPENFAKVLEQAKKLTPVTNVTDAKAFVTWLDTQRPVDKRKGIGTQGYCMGGPMVMRTAAAIPDRIGAVASFHGGGLATDKADSPHLLIPQMKASFLIAIAENDDAKAPQEKDVLKAAFEAAGLPAEIEVYTGTMHGWCPTDSKVYHKEQAERAWSRLLALYGQGLSK
jgi:carboxymethylenebutenolidase